MTTPRVTEIPQPLEPVTPDGFADEPERNAAPTSHDADERERQRGARTA